MKSEFSGAVSTHHPRFVSEVVDRVQAVGARDRTVLESDDEVSPVAIDVLGRLPDQKVVRPKRSV